MAVACQQNTLVYMSDFRVSNILATWFVVFYFHVFQTSHYASPFSERSLCETRETTFTRFSIVYTWIIEDSVIEPLWEGEWG